MEPLWSQRLNAHIAQRAAPPLTLPTPHPGSEPSSQPIAPVDRLTIVALKYERQLHVFAHHAGAATRLATYPILAASGTLGPKLREGDRQVPEGLYAIESLNPNSRFHLALRVNYPSPDDHAAARADGRDTATLGGDIMIHGGAASIGCIAIGNEAIEELFWLADRVGLDRIDLLLAPSSTPASLIRADTPPWLRDRYEMLHARLLELGIP